MYVKGQCELKFESEIASLLLIHHLKVLGSCGQSGYFHGRALHLRPGLSLRTEDRLMPVGSCGQPVYFHGRALHL